MGKFKTGNMGLPTGKVGNLIYSSWNGIPYVKMKPAVVRNPRTAAQTRSRNGFRLILGIISPLSVFIREGFKGHAQGMSAYNAAMSYNMRNAVGTGTAGPVILYENLRFSAGDHIPLFNPVISFTIDGKIEIEWDLPENDLIDPVTVILVDEQTNTPFHYPFIALRRDGKLNVNPPEGMQGHTIHIYLSLFATGSLQSKKAGQGIANSVYAGKLVWE